MKTSKSLFYLLLLLPPFALAKEKPNPTPAPAEIRFSELRYDCRVTDTEARFGVDLSAESSGNPNASIALFEGELSLLPPKLPDGVQLLREENRYRLRIARPGAYHLKLDFVAKINRAEPWNQVAFQGPLAVIGSIVAEAPGAEVDLQLLTGTTVESHLTNGVSRVRGYLGAESGVALRWQSRAAEVARKAVVAAETVVAARVTPTVVKYHTEFHYDVIQGKLSRITVALPTSHALTRLVGEQIRDWSIASQSDKQILTVEFITPREKAYQLTVLSEQTVEATAAAVTVLPPQPLEAERESGAISLAAEDTQVDVESATGLRQINAAAGDLAAYRFNARPFAFTLRLKRIEPVVTAHDRATIRLEETRLLASHQLTLQVEKAGLYNLELQPQPGLVVAEVRGEGVEDWKVSEGKLRVGFTNRVLGERRLDVQLEQPWQTFPAQIVVQPLHVTLAARETAQLGAASAPGIQLKTAESQALREIPVNRLAARTDELLAYTAEVPDWKLVLNTERLAARVVAELFNLVTIGDGLVGGSATIRYGLINQGVQEFRVRVPAIWKNVEFTGPDIRRKEMSAGPDLNTVIWTVGLQEKAWGAYTLVVTYDYPFDPRGATLPIAGVHAAEVERETGSVAITTAAGLKLDARPAADPLRRVDEAELAEADRALISRSVLLAYQYSGDHYDLAVEVKRFAEASVLSAVADRTQLTSVLTDAGELLTQASFMVKNNDKQFQGFLLPGGANFWSCYVNGQPAKPERDGDRLLVPLPRVVNRDEAFAVDLVYAQTNLTATHGWAQALALQAPRTDVPNTYAEWQLYVPATRLLTGFSGNMNVAAGTTYSVLDAWQQFLIFYGAVLREIGPEFLVFALLAVLVVALVVSAVRRGWNGILTVLLVLGIASILASMMLPALGKAKARAQRISAINNLKQIVLAAKQYSLDNGDRLPNNYQEMINELNTLRITEDPESGQQIIYLGAGLRDEDLKPESVLAYTPMFNGHCSVAFGDGSVQSMSAAKFGELTARGLIQLNNPAQAAALAQQRAVAASQLPAPGSALAAAAKPPPGKPAGPRAIRIEIPRTGNAFTFTKVLNINDSTLQVSAQLMSVESAQRREMARQVGAFVAGLVLWFWQWRKQRNSFLLTVALVLMLGSVSSLLIARKALHEALIIGIPAILVAVIAGLIWKFWPRQAPEEPGLELSGAPEFPPAAATALVVLLTLAGGGASQAAPAAPPPPGENTAAASIRSASYAGNITERVAQFEATFQISSTRDGARLGLFSNDVAMASFSAKPAGARILRDGKMLAVQLGRKGETTLQLQLLVPLGGDVAKRQLAFDVPPALTSRLTLTIDQPDADVEFPAAISLQRATEAQRTRLDALMSANGRVQLAWTPRVKRAAETAATVICQQSALASFGGGVLGVRSVFDYQVTQGELRSARVQLPPGHRLLRVEGEGIRTWNTKSEGEAMIVLVELLKGASPAYRLVVESEKPLDVLPAATRVELPHALDVKRETGLIGLRSEDEMELAVTRSEQLQRVDPAVFAGAAAGENVSGIVSAFRFLKTDFALEARAAALQPQIEALVQNHLRVGDDQLNLSGTVDYTIKRAGVFALRLAVPEAYRVESVTGPHGLQWTRRDAAGQASVQVTFQERILGACSLRLELVRDLKSLPPTLEVAGVQPLDGQKLAGYLSVAAAPGIALKTAAFEGVSEIPLAALPPEHGAKLDSSALAFKFLANESGVAAWKLTLATETMTPWSRADVAVTYKLSEALVSGRALVRYDIQNAPVRELRLRIPAALRNVEITGANIRRRDQDGESWRVELQNKVRGTYLLTVTWDQSRPPGTNRVDLTGLTVEGSERETGTIAVAGKAPLQVVEATTTDLLKLDAREWPDWAGGAEPNTMLAYRYLRPGYQLAVEVRRFSEAEVLQTIAENFNLATVVAEDGQMMTALTLAVRNNGRQHLELTLPPGADVWSAFVAGQAVRPSWRGARLLLPLENAGSDDAALAIELTYVMTNQFPAKSGRVKLLSPTLDVPFKNARWELYLPPDYRYDEFTGTMSRETGPASETANYSFLEYSHKESTAKAEAWKGLQSDISSARKKLAEGNVKEAQSSYSRALNNSQYGANQTAEAREVEAELRRVQASNLVNAQQAFAVANNGVAVPSQNQQIAAKDFNANYDTATAERQWEKLQQAQEVAVAKVRPLRVNLPTRGVRQVFGQVLQTETGKAMTVAFQAENLRNVSWPKRIGGGVIGFAALWAVVALVTGRGARAKASA